MRTKSLHAVTHALLCATLLASSYASATLGPDTVAPQDMPEAVVDAVRAWPESVWGRVDDGKAPTWQNVPCEIGTPIEEPTFADAPRLLFAVLGESSNAVAWTFIALAVALPFAATMAAMKIARSVGHTEGWNSHADLVELRERHAEQDRQDEEQPQFVFTSAPSHFAK